MAEEQEQNRSEAPSPFKLRRAREKGMVARGMDLGFFAGLAALAVFTIVAGEAAVRSLAQVMRRSLGAGIANAGDPQQAAAAAGAAYWPALQPVILFGGTVVLVVLLVEIIQLRGLVFTTHPLKPDFSRLNPAKGLKRLFSMRMLKEAAKNVIKLAAYATVAWLVLRGAADNPGRAAIDAEGLAASMASIGLKLLLWFLLLAFIFAALDQIIVRREYFKQMRMSRREMTREHKEREGDPRMKQKRKQIHAEYAKQARQSGSLPGSDLLIVNPQHFAVGLAYDSAKMAAPTVTAKARDGHALALKKRAFALGIPIFEAPPLARALYDQCDTGTEIHAGHFNAVADLYLKLQRARAARETKRDDVQDPAQ